MTEAYWYHGEIDRKVAEKLITVDSLPGNFLVRKRKGDKKTFVHSYLSMSQNKVVHNLMEFQRDPSGTQTLMVDSREFSTASLDDAVNKIQDRLKTWRKFKEVGNVIGSRTQTYIRTNIHTRTHTHTHTLTHTHSEREREKKREKERERERKREKESN